MYIGSITGKGKGEGANLDHAYMTECSIIG